MAVVGGRTWALIVITGKYQYGGNAGYDDDLTRVYRYDSAVANSRRLSEALSANISGTFTTFGTTDGGGGGRR